MGVTKVLPEIRDWPYVEIAKAHAEFCTYFGKEPSRLLIGPDLWLSLREVTFDQAIYASTIPIVLDMTGIIVASDFLFCR